MKVHLIIISVLLTLVGLKVFPQGTNTGKFGSNSKNGSYVTIDNNKIYYETYGQGTPLLLLHGGLGSIENFELCIPELATHFRVIAMDSPGHGRSSHTDSLSYSFLSDQISKFIDLLNFDSLYIMGWSDGGVVGLLLAANRPDKVKKLIAVGANTRLDGIDEEGIAWMKNSMVESFKNNKEWLENYKSLTPEPDKAISFLKNTQKMWLTDIYIPETRLKSISIPTMIVQGDRDGISIEHAAETFRSIANAQLFILPNTSHFVFSEKPDLISNMAIGFFNSK